MKHFAGVVVGLVSIAPLLWLIFFAWWVPDEHTSNILVLLPLLLWLPYIFFCGRLISDEEKRSDWRALLFFAHIFAIPFFWFWYVRPYFWPESTSHAAV